jgi:hypothetical protein
MPRDRIDFDAVRRIGLSLPDVEESTAYGSPALKVRGNLLTCLPTHRSAEADSLAVRIDFEKRSVLVAAAPDTYYLTDHYRNYPVVLVRLSRIGLDELRNLLEMAWQFVSTQKRRGRVSAQRSGRRTRD